MNQAIYGSFMDTKQADKAVGALMDHGIPAECISLVMNDGTADSHHLDKAKHGITTTTGGDTAAGAMKGGVTGLVLGALGALAALIIPGFGLVLGGGALATALGAMAGTAVGGAIAGAVHGTLKDQGVPDEAARRYDETVSRGGAVLAIQPCGGREFDRAEAESILRKYGAENIGGYPFAGAAAAPDHTLAAADTTRPLNLKEETMHHHHGEEGVMRLHEEELDVRKHEREVGEVELRKEVITENKHFEVPVEREEVVIERRPVMSSGVDGGDGTIGHVGEHETLRIPIRQEEVDVTKHTRAVEEVSVGKRVLQGTEHVNETLRKERAVIEDHGDVDIHPRRNHDGGLL